MQIAPGVDASVWRELKLDDPDSPARLHDRYIQPVDFLIASEWLEHVFDGVSAQVEN